MIRQLIRLGEHSRFLFLSERRAPLSIDGAQKLIERLGEAARLPFPIHAACYGTRPATRSLVGALIPGPRKPSWDIGRSPIRSSTRRSPTSASGISGIANPSGTAGNSVTSWQEGWRVPEGSKYGRSRELSGRQACAAAIRASSVPLPSLLRGELSGRAPPYHPKSSGRRDYLAINSYGGLRDCQYRLLRQDRKSSSSRSS